MGRVDRDWGFSVLGCRLVASCARKACLGVRALTNTNAWQSAQRRSYSTVLLRRRRRLVLRLLL